MNIEDAAVGGGLVLLGFFMSVGWETFKKKRQEAADRERLLARVNLEMEDNREKCASLMDAVDHNRLDGKVNIVALQDQRFIIHDRDKRLFRVTDEILRVSEVFENAHLQVEIFSAAGP